MDPSRPHPLAQALTDAISPSDRTDRTVAVEDMDFALRYAPEPGVDLRIRTSVADEPDQAVVVTNFDAAAERPPSYPPELPYLPGLKVGVMALPDRPGLSAMWLMPDDVESAAAAIRAQSEAAGWMQSDEPGVGVFRAEIQTIVLTREGWCRTIVVVSLGASSTITLVDAVEGE
jgi:DNA-binding transcriptional LysR family regulator